MLLYCLLHRMRSTAATVMAVAVTSALATIFNLHTSQVKHCQHNFICAANLIALARAGTTWKQV